MSEAFATFTVAFRLKGVQNPLVDDEKAGKLLGVLDVISERSAREPSGTLAGGGGYGDTTKHVGERLRTAVFLLQKNTHEGKLASCTEEDRARTIETLQTHPLVENFVVGPLSASDDWDEDEEEKYVRDFLLGLSGEG